MFLLITTLGGAYKLIITVNISYFTSPIHSASGVVRNFFTSSLSFTVLNSFYYVLILYVRIDMYRLLLYRNIYDVALFNIAIFLFIFANS